MVKIGRTELQDAVLTTLGREMGGLRRGLRPRPLADLQVRGAAARGEPRRHGHRHRPGRPAAVHLPRRRAPAADHRPGPGPGGEPVEATQNADVFVEVSGILRTLAANLLKIANDLRLLSSGPRRRLGEIRLPPRQAGSSIMPGKVNPVIPEAVAQAAIAVMGHDQMIVQAARCGNLELNQFLPLVADSLLTSLDLLAERLRHLRPALRRGHRGRRDALPPARRTAARPR